MRRLGPGKSPRQRWFHWSVALALLTPVVVCPQVCMAHGEIHLRIAELTRQIEAATNNPARLYLARGELHRKHGEWQFASADYDRAAQLDPKLAGVYLCRARLLADSGDLPAARAMFDTAIAHAPADGECYVGRARVLIKLGQRPAAIADYRRGVHLLKQPPPEYFLELAQALEAEGQVAEALASLDEGIRIHGPVVSLQGYAVELELGRKQVDAALARIDTLLVRVVRKESWLAKRGDILVAAGRPAEARNAYRSALSAINRLPRPLRQGPAMLKLQTRVNTALATTANTAAGGS